MEPVSMALAGLALVALMGRLKGSGYSYGSATPGKAPASAGGGELDRNPAHLEPTFAAVLELVFTELRAMGFDPMLYEGRRDPERAERLKELGYSQLGSLSVHCWDVAADIISESQAWGSSGFFEALGTVAKAHGLTWGGDWSFYDPAHVQAVPTTAQPSIRATASTDERTAIVKEFLA